MKQNYEIFLEFLKSIYIIRKHSHVSIKQARVTKNFFFKKTIPFLTLTKKINVSFVTLQKCTYEAIPC